MNIKDIITESKHKCPHCGGPVVEYSELMEKKDACYYKVKASAKVWPSAYASGRLVQCRKKGASNYGNKSEGVAEAQLDEKCWDTHKQVGMKNKGGRQVPDCRPKESIDEDLSRRGFLKGAGAAAMAGAAGSAMAQSRPVDVSREFQNMRQDDPRVQHNKDIEEMARAIYEQIVATRGQPIDRRQQQMWMTIAREKATEKLSKYAPGRPAPQSQSSGFPSQGSERRVSRNIDNFESQGMAEGYTDDDIETTRQFRKAIAGLKARSAIDKAKDGAGAKYYYDGAKVTPQETARRAAERKAQKDKKGMAEGASISGDGGAVDNFRQQMANRTELAYQKGMAEAPGAETLGHNQSTVASNEKAFDLEEGNRKPEPPEADYGDDYQDMVKRVKKLAGLGPLKTQYDPARRVYRNMPTAVQPKK